jgi:hypothetical protein
LWGSGFPISALRSPFGWRQRRRALEGDWNGEGARYGASLSVLITGSARAGAALGPPAAGEDEARTAQCSAKSKAAKMNEAISGATHCYSFEKPSLLFVKISFGGEIDASESFGIGD